MALVAGINNKTNKDTEVIMSDGYYCLKSILKQKSTHDNITLSNDDKIISLISNKLYPGMKLTLIN